MEVQRMRALRPRTTCVMPGGPISKRSGSRQRQSVSSTRAIVPHPHHGVPRYCPDTAGVDLIVEDGSPKDASLAAEDDLRDAGRPDLEAERQQATPEREQHESHRPPPPPRGAEILPRHRWGRLDSGGWKSKGCEPCGRGRLA